MNGAYKPEREDDIEVTGEFREALALIEDGEPFVFLTGKAGTGKSTFVRYLRRQCRKKMALLAPTGIAALQLGGQTIHSFFRFPAAAGASIIVRALRDKKLMERLELLVIDEMSMVRADLLDAVNRSLQLNRRNDLPFGGVQVLAVGDLFQLPPVVATEEEDRLLEKRYGSPFFFSAEVLRDHAPRFVELTQVFRQVDQRFINLLQSIREVDDCESAVQTLNEICVGRRFAEEAVVLTCTNRSAELVNNSRLAELPGRAAVLQGHIEGDFTLRPERLPAPLQLELKLGAQVMFTRNDPDRRWMNGSMGTVLEIGDSRIKVAVWEGKERTPCTVEEAVWEAYEYCYDEREDRIIPEVVGFYQQFPLRPAWAVTIHKSQGLTLNRAEVDFGRGAFASGQVYVALSRCRTLEGISLRRPLRGEEIHVDPRIKQFYQEMRRRPRG